MAGRGDWQGNDWDDAPDYIRERMQRLSRRRGITPLGLLSGIAVSAVLGGTLYLLFVYGPLRPAVVSELQPAVLAEPVPQPAPYPVSERPVPVQPSNDASLPHQPRPLAECLGEDKVIDESVVRCRYGELPRSVPVQRPQGMVSEGYLARYRNERADTSTNQRSAGSSVEKDVQWVRKWDGNGAYSAHWQVRDNRIDYGSVCANQRRGSIDYRECRKGAKQFFNEQCRAWGKRWEQAREPWSKRMEDRYCSASNGFSPMG